MRSFILTRVGISLLIGVLAPPLLTQCTTTQRTYKDVKYSAAKLKTPPGHGMQRKDYPFDEKGMYRKDWVKANATGRDPSAAPASQTGSVSPGQLEKSSSESTEYPTLAQASAARSMEAANITATTTAGAAASVGATSTQGAADTAGIFVGPAVGASDSSMAAALTSSPEATVTVGTSASGEQPTVSVAPVASAAPAAKYHKVTSGETLFALATRYKTSVADLKRVNGLTSDSIRVGQNLRLP